MIETDKVSEQLALLSAASQRYLSADALFGRHCEGQRPEAISHSSSYKSRQSLFMLLINLTFFRLDPPLICFSLKIAFSISL
jgi:hypothetical protein